MIKVIIAGGRDFLDLELVKATCEHMLQNHKDIEIVSGTCRGADLTGEDYANLKGYPIAKFPADWEKHNKAAGHIRNEQMANYADALIAFWDGKSRGTNNMIEQAKKKGLKVKIVKYT